MSPARRIFWNIVATYGRSLYGLLMGLFCGRWALMALGDVDFGLNGLIGGLMVFVAFFNNILAGANERFYTYSIGVATVTDDKALALEECRHWFNTALSVHTIVPLCVVLVGYPIGTYAITNWLTIPPNRIDACIWVFRFACLSCFVGMLNVPFTAMYRAKQYIAELTIYSFATSTLNVIFLYYMVSHPSEWLATYAAWTCFLSIVPQIIICIRALYIFPECKICFAYMWEKDRLKKIGAFSFWQMFGSFCGILRNQGMFIVVNKFFGATMNAAQSIGNTVQGQCFSLASAMQGAFVPVITQAYGAGKYELMNEYVIRVCKFNILLSAIFIVPLSLELETVLRIWLKTPPEFCVGLTYCALAIHIVSACTVGHMIAVNASGNIAKYQIVLSLINIFTIPFAMVVGCVWKNVFIVMGVAVIMEIVNSIGRVIFARLIVDISVKAWIREALNISIILSLSALIGMLAHIFMDKSLLRVFVTTIICEMVLLPLAWFVALSGEERSFVVNKVLRKKASISF